MSILAPSFSPLMLSRVADPTWQHVAAWAAMIPDMTPERFRVEHTVRPLDAWAADPEREDITVRELAEQPNRRQRPAPSAAAGADRAFTAYTEAAVRWNASTFEQRLRPGTYGADAGATEARDGQGNG